jgi:hypothetical protein
MEALILAVVPLVVTALTSITKRIPVIKNLPDGVRIASIRLVAAIFSFIGASAVFALGGDPVTQTSANELVLAFVTFLGALGGHDLLKNKSDAVVYNP